MRTRNSFIMFIGLLSYPLRMSLYNSLSPCYLSHQLQLGRCRIFCSNALGQAALMFHGWGQRDSDFGPNYRPIWQRWWGGAVGFLDDASQLDKQFLDGSIFSPMFVFGGVMVCAISSWNPYNIHTYPFRQEDYQCACCLIPCSSCRSSFQFSDLENMKPAWQQADIKRKDICWWSICYFVFQLAHDCPRWCILCLWLDKHGDRRWGSDGLTSPMCFGWTSCHGHARKDARDSWVCERFKFV